MHLILHSPFHPCTVSDLYFTQFVLTLCAEELVQALRNWGGEGTRSLHQLGIAVKLRYARNLKFAILSYTCFGAFYFTFYFHSFEQTSIWTAQWSIECKSYGNLCNSSHKTIHIIMITIFNWYAFFWVQVLACQMSKLCNSNFVKIHANPRFARTPWLPCSSENCCSHWTDGSFSCNYPDYKAYQWTKLDYSLHCRTFKKN